MCLALPHGCGARVSSPSRAGAGGNRRAAAHVSGVIFAKPQAQRERVLAGLRQRDHVLDHVVEVRAGPEAEQLQDDGGADALTLGRVAQVRGVARDLDARLGLRAARERDLFLAQRCETRARARVGRGRWCVWSCSSVRTVEHCCCSRADRVSTPRRCHLPGGLSAVIDSGVRRVVPPRVRVGVRYFFLRWTLGTCAAVLRPRQSSIRLQRRRFLPFRHSRLADVVKSGPRDGHGCAE